jgi:uncharacterized membrane protein
MNTKAVQWLYQELPELVSKGVLSSESSDNLHRHYGVIKTTDKKGLALMLCGILGALLIGLGIISIIAHNWENLSRAVRGIISFLPLIIGQGLALMVLLKWPTSSALKEGTATFLSLMVGASIALISQTYNIPGETPDFILTWMLLILPVAYLMQAAIPAAFFAAGIASWAGCVAGNMWQPSNLSEPVLFWPLLGLIIPLFIWTIRQEKYIIRSTILSFVIAVSVIFGTGFSLGRIFADSWIIIYPSLAAVFFFLGSWEFKTPSQNWQRSFQVLGGLGSFILMFVMSFKEVWKYKGYGNLFYSQYDVSSWQAVPAHIFTLLLTGAALLCFVHSVKHKDHMKTLFCALPIVALIGYGFLGGVPEAAMWLLSGYLLVVSVARIMLGVQNDNLGVVNSGMFMLAALVAARFFDSDIDFVIKGLVFILIGAGFLVTNVIMLKKRGQS